MGSIRTPKNPEPTVAKFVAGD